MDDASKILSESNPERNNITYKNKNSKEIKIEKINKKIYYKYKNCFQICNKMAKNICNCNNYKGKINQNNVKKRNPGVDLARLIAMFFIIFNHYIYFGEAFKKYPQYNKYLLPMHNLTDWNNNCFALISGIVGYKTNKYSNLMYLWVMVFFYSVGIHMFIKIFIKKYIIKHDISIDLFPIVFQRYWYFTAYFGMYLYLPVINKGISCLTKYEFRLVVLSILTILVLWKDFKNPDKDVFNLRGGNSMIWLMTFYLIGAYIGKYKREYSGIKKYIYCFICLFIYAFPTYIFTRISNNQSYLGNRYLTLIIKRILTKRSDSFFKISQSISVILFCLQIQYNEYISKIICFIGRYTFGVYLIHSHPILIINLLKHIFDNLPNDASLNSILLLLFLSSIKIFIFCIIIDYFRDLLFFFLRIRKICICLETRINQTFARFE